MQTDSSAMATCLRLRSTVECTATVRMPRAWHARRMRSAISPRLAITTLSSMGLFSKNGSGKAQQGTMGWGTNVPGAPSFPFALPDNEQRLVELDRLAVLDHHLEHGAGDVGFDRV